ncbi:MAG TPA: sodium:proton antiporter [Thermomicrobiales bacterium]|nr:sodium:proton antiporter [Thermomicrobiales bacterium]
MTLLVSIAVAVMFGVAAYLMLKRDLIRVITGMILLGNAANLFIMSAGLREGGAPLVGEEGDLSDPLVQALTLTAIVIGFGTAALVLGLVYRVYDSHQSVDIIRIGDAEELQASMDDQPLPGDVSALDQSAIDNEAEVKR